MIPPRALLPLAAAMAGCTALPPPVLSRFETAQWQGSTASYRCADGTRVGVTYLNPRQGDALAVLIVGGQQAVLRGLPAASGARYADLDEQRGLRWHVKAGEGRLAVLAPDHTAQERALATQCQEIR